MVKIVIIGSNGLLGQSLVKRFNQKYDVYGCSIEPKNYTNFLLNENYFKLDITSRTDVKNFFLSIQPDIVINAAAYTNVDKCEEDREACWAVNTRSVENIVEACKVFSPILVYLSTDYVFDGKNAPYHENDIPNPHGFYGKSKLAGEKVVKENILEYIIIRTQILYGIGKNVKKNFVLWVKDKLSNNQKIQVVNDQIGNPTYVDDVSEAIFKLLDLNEYGIFHVSGKEKCTRYEFAKKIAEVFNLEESLIEEITSSELKQKAPRPMNSTFVLDKLFNKTNWLPNDILNGLNKLKRQLNENIV
jgi:dTDP-4-dehydrorhamnose reductase